MSGMAAKAKELRYAVELGAGDTLREEAGVPLTVPAGWTPEHLLLGALVRCSLKSLRHHATRSGLQVATSECSARALVTRRESDGRYALVEAELELSVELDPRLHSEPLAELLAKAERDCFVGASLQAKPSYRWTVNGVVV
jgi:organic hydroperoxide reductase OsmC/OhrA